MKPVQALITTLTILTTALTAGHVNAGSIENLERERTILVGNLLTPEITGEERQAKLSVSQRRLIDLERYPSSYNLPYHRSSYSSVIHCNTA